MSLTNLDSELLFAINALARAIPWLQPIIWSYATYGVVLFAMLLVFGWWLARQRNNYLSMTTALWAPLGVLAAVGINQPVADWLNRPRPYALYPGLLVLAQHSADPALPSDHAVMAGAVTAGLFLVNRRLGWWASVAAIIMAFARVYIAAHFPLDVISGLLLGAAVSFLGYPLARPILSRLVNAAANSRLQPLINKHSDAGGIGPATANAVNQHRTPSPHA